jgi:hypothetical protein
MDMRFGTWNVRWICRVGSLKTAANILSKFELCFVVAEVEQCKNNGHMPADGKEFPKETGMMKITQGLDSSYLSGSCSEL